MLAALRPVLPTSTTAEDGVLHIGGVSVRTLAQAYGTPVIAYDQRHVEQAAQAWLDAFADHGPGVTVAYASKAFSSIGMLRLLHGLGLGADVASLGELEVALRAGVSPERIVLHGNNKSVAMLERAVTAGARYIVLDAEQELDTVERIARDHGVVQGVLVRVNPDIVVETHRYISTSHAGSKFGVDVRVARRMLERAAASAHLDALGIHVHLGSQLLDVAPWQAVLESLGDWAAELRDESGIEIQVLDVGGGLGIAYLPEQHPPRPVDVASTVSRALEQWRSRGLTMPHLIVEPGRSIVGQAACTIYTVGVTKATGDDDIRYVNVDGGMSDNPRPSLYQARYRALLGERLDDPASTSWWVAGVHCESGDVLVEDALLPEPHPGDLLVIPATGAYAASMASTYNLVPRCAVVLVCDGQHRPLLHRETMAALLARDADADADQVANTP